MLNFKRTKIVSTPVEEILEVKTAVEQEIQHVANIEFLTVQGEDERSAYGILTDYDGNAYNYEWDFKSKRIIRLSGSTINSLTWNLCNEVLRKFYIKSPKPVEEPIGQKIEEAVNKALNPIGNAFKNIEGKLDKALTTKVASAPAPVQAQSAPRPQSVQSAPVDAPAINVADNDISVNALKFLQQSQSDDLGIDYLSL